MDKSPAGCNTVQEYLYDDLASDSEDDKKLNAAEARALRKQKFKEKKNVFFLFDKSTHATKQSTTSKVFVPSSTITKPISSISSTITRDTYRKNIKNSSNGQGFVSDVQSRVTTETNVDLTKERT